MEEAEDLSDTKTCNFCDKPLTKILLGEQGYPVWVHRGKQLLVCKAMKLKVNVMGEIIQTIQKVGKNRKVEVERKNDGEVTIFGETRIKN